ncbi:MAG: hypothetical protein ACE5M4_12040 [Anaerolineales bacterium]
MLLALTGLAVALPLLDLFGQSPEYFVARGFSRAAILLFALAVAFFVPMVMVVIEATGHAFNPPIGRLAHHSFVTLLSMGLALLMLGKLRSVPTGAAVVASASLSVGLSYLELRERGSGTRPPSPHGRPRASRASLPE